ncbi:GNAT family N-acetyltransferase [Parerythrobacter jejuensis]|uniref:N-acetyltransferase n=1 Tax=Parerythrobacter jejuensis TaxID=795812 RepID=A0A845AMZ4_9SPHN|nr:GNAT family N-acetyltransferase [Parerythrobacter jejuensis]MXP30829.1 N-acetyltransferase [Parerythrobacter jejuensis]MXP33589.1 N-acetyltransferase [Parerythrobacter jejuensis]
MAEDHAKVTITHHVQGQGGKYVAHVDGSEHTGYLEWEPRDSAGKTKEDVHVATHTVVPQAIGGRGIAGQLVERLVADSRKYGFKIVPRCSYVAKKFEDNPEWESLRAK